MYDVKAAAEELMLDTEDLEIIYQQFFDDTKLELDRCKELTVAYDFDSLQKIAHSIKGVASNLRMRSLSTVAQRLECSAHAHDYNEIRNELKVMCNIFVSIQDEVTSFYA